MVLRALKYSVIAGVGFWLLFGLFVMALVRESGIYVNNTFPLSHQLLLTPNFSPGHSSVLSTFARHYRCSFLIVLLFTARHFREATRI